eukprot:3728756-Rhodomonas_salina.2
MRFTSGCVDRTRVLLLDVHQVDWGKTPTSVFLRSVTNNSEIATLCIQLSQVDVAILRMKQL